MSREINDMDEPSMLSSHSKDGQDAGAEGINNGNDMVDDEFDGDQYLAATTRAFESSTSGEPMGDDSNQVSATTPKKKKSKKKSKKKKKKKKKKNHEHHEQEAKMEESFESRTESSFDQLLPTNIQEYVPHPETMNDVPSGISYKDQGLSLEEIHERIRNRNASIHGTPIDVPSDISYKDQGLSLEEIRESTRNASIHRTPIDVPSQIDYKDQGLTLQELQQREILAQRAIRARTSKSQSTTPSLTPIAYARPLSLFNPDTEQGDLPLVPLNNETPSTPPPRPSVNRDSNDNHAVAEHDSTGTWFGGKKFWKWVTLVGLLVAFGLTVGIPLALSSRGTKKSPAGMIGTPSNLPTASPTARPTVPPGFEFVSAATFHPTAYPSLPKPTTVPTTAPALEGTNMPTRVPTTEPSAVSAVSPSPSIRPSIRAVQDFWQQIGQDLDGEAAGDEFGSSVALSADGMTVAAGGIGNDANGVDSGHVRVYQYDSTASQWLKLGQDLDGEAARDMFGYSVALSADGMTVAVGGPYIDGSGIVGSGIVRVYQYNSNIGEWLRLGQEINGEFIDDFLGDSVALSADGMTVAAGGTFVTSYVRIYQYDSTLDQWLKLGEDVDGDFCDGFGRSVALSADGMTVAVGGPYNAADSGYVSVYQYDSTFDLWLRLGQELNGEAAAGEGFGLSVALSADGMTVAAGGPFTSSGHVRVYQYDSTASQWLKLGQDLDGEAAGDMFGYSVALSADGMTVAVGATRNDANGVDSGHVCVYQYDSTASQWLKLDQDLDGEAAGDMFGYSVALSADGMAVAVGGSGSDVVKCFEWINRQ